jgi:hypothetical protein
VCHQQVAQLVGGCVCGAVDQEHPHSLPEFKANAPTPGLRSVHLEVVALTMYSSENEVWLVFDAKIQPKSSVPLDCTNTC